MVQNGENTYPVTDDDIYVGSDNYFVASYESTAAGTISPVGQSETANYFARIMLFAHNTVSEFQARYKVRAYALMEDGDYLYSNISTFSIYNVADALYQGNLMNSLEGHNYLYDKILKRVTPDYAPVEYDWHSSIVQ